MKSNDTKLSKSLRDSVYRNNGNVMVSRGAFALTSPSCDSALTRVKKAEVQTGQENS